MCASPRAGHEDEIRAAGLPIVYTSSRLTGAPVVNRSPNLNQEQSPGGGATLSPTSTHSPVRHRKERNSGWTFQFLELCCG